MFTPNKGYRGWSALDCNRLSYDKEGLLLGMSYRGTYAKIFGKDSKGDSHDYNVLCHIIDSILRKGNDSQRIIIDTFAEYISGWNIDKRNDIIAQFLQDDSLCKKLISMLPVMKNYQSENSSYIEVINAMTTSIGNSIFSKMNISIFDALPSDFDYSAYHDQTIAVIEASSKEYVTGVSQWLSKHQTFLNELLTEVETLSLDLLYAVYESTKDINVLINSKKPLGELYNFLKEKSDSLARNILLAFLADRDDEFVEQCRIKEFIDAAELKVLVWKFLDDDTRYSAVLRNIADVFVLKDIDVLKNYIQNGIDIS